MEYSYKWNVFVSHNKIQKPWVRQFVQTLRGNNLEVFFDEDTIQPGENVVNAIESGICNSQFIVLIISPDSVKSRWVSAECAMATMSDPDGQDRKIIPVLLEITDENKIPLSIRTRNLVDLTIPERNKIEYNRLLESLGVDYTVLTPPSEPKITLPDESPYVKFRIKDLVLKNASASGVDLSDVWHKVPITYDLLLKRARLMIDNPSPDKIANILFAARCEAYDAKYAKLPDNEDTRYINFFQWESELRKLINDIGIRDLERVRCINVGIGNGGERPYIYNEFKKILAVDISLKSLVNAKSIMPFIEILQADSADLKEIKNNSFDLYLSLRTYQSTLFEIENSVFEAYRVLRPGGSIIISVSNAHKAKDSIVQGILRGDGKEVDFDLPYSIANQIRSNLTRLSFQNIGLQTGYNEIYIYGIKTR